MSRVCQFTGKRTTAGRKYDRRGKAKYLGGVGRKVTGISKRKFRPNLQRVRVVTENGAAKRVRVCAACIRAGRVTKRPRRRVRDEA